jgi:hypothetical protein
MRTIFGALAMIFTADDVHTRINREHPFQPVQLVTSTGQTYDVYHPELVLFARHFMYIGLPNKQQPYVADQVTRLAYVHLAEMRDLPVPAGSGSNGHA